MTTPGEDAGYFCAWCALDGLPAEACFRPGPPAGFGPAGQPLCDLCALGGALAEDYGVEPPASEPEDDTAPSPHRLP